MKRLAASCFGLGRLPVAPGTWGSLPPTVVFALMCQFSVSAGLISVVMAVLALAGAVVCVKFAPAAIAATGKTDPREVVADEFSGQAVTFLAAAFLLPATVSPGRVWAAAAAGFVLFRLFDIFKPWPIRKFEKLPKGWGILSDDLMAGVYASIVLLVFIRFEVIACLTRMLYFEHSSLNVIQAAFLGAVQGLTEFLPVSSSGHLVLFEDILHFQPERPEMLLFDLATHIGTLVAICVVFRKSAAGFIRNLFAFSKYGTTALQIYKKSPSVHFLTLAIVTTFVTGSLGVLFEGYFTAARGNLAVVAVMWAITATLLLITDRRRRTRLGLRQFTIKAAILVGIAQSVAIMPGISRSGATICAAILIGLHRRWAVEFSFLIAIPAILGASAIECIQHYAVLKAGSLPISSAFIGSAVAAAMGILALKLLIRAARTAKFRFFALYCYILAFVVLIYLLI